MPFLVPKLDKMAAKIHVEANYDFVCIVDDFLSNFVFARTMKNLEFYWQGPQNQRSRLLRTRCDFRQLFATKNDSFREHFGSKNVQKTCWKTRLHFSTPLGRHRGAFGTFLGHEATWPWVKGGQGRNSGGTVEPQALHFCSLAPPIIT